MDAVTTVVAGLQYHLRGVLPSAGDVVELVRQPDNPHDPNAVRVVWSGRMIGHLPRCDAAVVAPRMDAGASVTGMVGDPGDGSPWSMTLLLSGDAVADLAAEEDVPF